MTPTYFGGRLWRGPDDAEAARIGISGVLSIDTGQSSRRPIAGRQDLRPDAPQPFAALAVRYD
jgi:hypothetical protein